MYYSLNDTRALFLPPPPRTLNVSPPPRLSPPLLVLEWEKWNVFLLQTGESSLHLASRDVRPCTIVVQCLWLMWPCRVTLQLDFWVLIRPRLFFFTLYCSRWRRFSQRIVWFLFGSLGIKISLENSDTKRNYEVSVRCFSWSSSVLALRCSSLWKY